MVDCFQIRMTCPNRWVGFAVVQAQNRGYSPAAVMVRWSPGSTDELLRDAKRSAASGAPRDPYGLGWEVAHKRGIRALLWTQNWAVPLGESSEGTAPAENAVLDAMEKIKYP